MEKWNRAQSQSNFEFYCNQNKSQKDEMEELEETEQKHSYTFQPHHVILWLLYAESVLWHCSLTCHQQISCPFRSIDRCLSTFMTFLLF